MTTNQTAPVTDEELDQMIWKLERDGMTPKMLSLMRELREVRRAKGEPVAWMYDGEDGREYNGHNEFSGGGKGVPLYAAPSAAIVPDTFMPKNLDRALGVVGVALPESKEEFNFQIERWTQRLIDRVIRYADEFQEPTVSVVPDELTREEYKRRFMADDCFDDTFRGGWNACRAAKLQAGNSRGTPDEQSFWNWLREEMPTTYRWSRELEDTPENSALITKGKASALDMLSAWKGCSAAMLQLSGNSEQLEPVSNRDELMPGIKPAPELDSVAKNAESLPGNSPETPDGWVIVPMDATLDMLKAGAKQEMKGEAFQTVWQAMIAAAPKEVE